MCVVFRASAQSGTLELYMAALQTLQFAASDTFRVPGKVGVIWYFMRICLYVNITKWNHVLRKCQHLCGPDLSQAWWCFTALFRWFAVTAAMAAAVQIKDLFTFFWIRQISLKDLIRGQKVSDINKNTLFRQCKSIKWLNLSESD